MKKKILQKINKILLFFYYVYPREKKFLEFTKCVNLKQTLSIATQNDE